MFATPLCLSTPPPPAIYQYPALMSTATSPTRGTVWLVLLPSTERLRLYLELPLVEMPQFTERPLKYLRYLAFVILGQDGTVSSEENNAMGDDDSLVDGAIYVFRPNDGQGINKCCLVIPKQALRTV